MFSRRWWSFCTLSFCLRIFAFWVGSPFFKFSYLRESFRCSRHNCFSSFLIRAVLLIFLFQPYPSKRRNLNPVSFAKTVFGIISYKIHFYIRSSFFLIPWKTTLMMEKSWKSCTGIFNRMFYRFGTDLPIVLCILIFCSSVGLISVLKLFSNLIILFWLIPVIIG